MKFDEKNIIVKDILTKDDMERLKESMYSSDSSNQVDDLGYYTWHLKMPDDIEEKFLKIAEDVCGEKLVLAEYNASKYQISFNEDGTESHPLLFPHTDEAFHEERFTLDYQLESNVTWPVAVKSSEGISEMSLSDNEACTFSGTHQIHWRPKRKFVPGEFVTLVFMHFKKATGAKELTVEHINHMRSLAKIEYEQWIRQEGRNNNKLYDPSNEPRYEKREKF